LTTPQTVFIPAGRAPALSVSFNDLSPTIFLGGTLLAVGCTITNEGQADLPLSSWTDGLYLFAVANASRQQVLSSGYFTSSYTQNRKLAVGSSYRLTFRGTLPHFLIGTFYVYIVTDVNGQLQVVESSNAPVLNTSIKVIPPVLPDLRPIANKTLYANVQSGLQYNVTFTVLNQVNGTAFGTWYDSVYLSRDTVLDPFDIVLKSAPNPSVIIDSSSSYTQHVTVTIPYDLTGQSYYFIVATNVRRQLVETSFDNNVDYQPVNIQATPVVDLAVTNVTFDRANVSYYDAMSFRWDVENKGILRAVGRKCDSVYLSTDDRWDISDIVLTDSTCNSFNIAPKQSSVYGSSEKIPPVAVGTYKAIVRTRSTLRDVYSENNVGVSAANMSITPPWITLNERKTLTFQTNLQLVLQMVNIPAGIAVTVGLSTNYRLAYHTLFIKKDSPPATNDYDIISKQLGTTQQKPP
jgi:hypothetical protein